MSHGIGSVVGKGEKNILNSEGFAHFLCLSIKREQRSSHGIVVHFNICPLNTVSEPPSDGFEESLFCCKSDGKTFLRPSLLLAPQDLCFCEDPTEKEGPPASHQTVDSINIYDINPRSDDHN